MKRYWHVIGIIAIILISLFFAAAFIAGAWFFVILAFMHSNAYLWGIFIEVIVLAYFIYYRLRDYLE